MNIRTLNDAGNLRGKYVLLRDDFNVQIENGKVTDAFRIEQSLPTIRALVSDGARVAILSHLGRPGGMRNMEFSLKPIAPVLSEKLNMQIPLIDDCIGDPVQKALKNMKDGDVILLENVRFYKGEEDNDSEFAKLLTIGFDVYVNDAFATAHRAHASTFGVTKFLPSYAGELLSLEIQNLNNLMNNPDKPLVAIVAGAKISTKLNLLRSMAKMCDKLIIDGGLGNTFQYALGKHIGNSLCESDMAPKALEILEIAHSENCEIYLPIDKGVVKVLSPDATRTDKIFDDILPADIIIDTGAKSIDQYKKVINTTKTIIWNGPVGKAEWPNGTFGTFALARYIAEMTRDGKLHSIVGGGDVVAALEATGTKNDMTYVSTGGGAFLEYLQGDTLPGIAALEK